MTDRGSVPAAGRRRFQLAVVAVSFIAVAMRTLPMYQSPLPFNPDGFIHASKAADALVDGHLPLARMATDDLHFEALLVVVSRVTGVRPLGIGQPLTALLGVGPVVLAVAVARRVCWRRGWSPSRARFAAVLAGLLLAVEGLYLHRSMATDEQTVGLFLVPLGVVAAYRAARSDRRAWWVAGVVVLAALPPLHNLDAMVAALALTTLLAVASVRRRRSSSTVRLAALVAAFWLAFAGYHLLVERYTPASIIQETRILAIPGLLLAWLVAVAITAAWLASLRPRTQRTLAGLVFGTLFGILALNAVSPIFPETRATVGVVLLLLFPLAVPVAFAIWRGSEVTSVAEGPALLALGGSVVALIGVSFTAALTPEYLNTALRSTTFLHLPVLVATGVGAVAVAAKYEPGTTPLLRIAVAGLVVASVVVSLPLAFGGLSMLTYKGVTTPGEYAASEFATTHGNDSWAADDHVARLAPAVRPTAYGSRGEIYEWLVGGSEPPRCLTVVQQSWTTTGAQLYPSAPARLSQEAYRSWLVERSIVYAGGGPDPIHAGVPGTGETGQC